MSLASVERYRRDRVPRRGAHATVLGASVAGLLAARVLADAFDRVTVIDRDPLHADSAARRGVPQGAHVHALMTAGQVTMEDLLPGFGDDLSAAGAVVLDISREFGMHLADGFLAEGEAAIPLFFASRPLIEHTLRAQVAAHDGVDLQPASQVGELSTADRGGIAGVTLRRDGEPQTLPAELVVDATGRASRAPAWLERLGYPPPPVEQVHVDLAYRTCQVKRPAEDRRGMLIAPSPPRARAGFLVPIEDDRWIVTLSGLHGDHPPADLDGLRAFAASLPTPVLREVLDQHPLATPEIAHYRFPTQTRHRYERLERLPARLVSIGDAVACFNPVYGQGMSVAALQALGLHHMLAEHDLDHLAGPFYRRIAGIIDGAWNIRNVKLFWPHRDSLIWPHPRRGRSVTVSYMGVVQSTPAGCGRTDGVGQVGLLSRVVMGGVGSRRDEPVSTGLWSDGVSARCRSLGHGLCHGGSFRRG